MYQVYLTNKKKGVFESLHQSTVSCFVCVECGYSVLIICGLPLGELTMGGQYKVFPKKLRIVLENV